MRHRFQPRRILISGYEMKTCTKCHEEKPLSSFSINKAAKSGMQAECRSCYAEMQKVGRRRREPLAAEKHEFRKNHPGMKKCSICDEIKGRDDFHIKGKTYVSVKSICKKCYYAYVKGRYHSIPTVRHVRKAATMQNWKDSPRQSLKNSLKSAVRRRPTENPVTVAELMHMWESQNGCCLLSGIKMTWAGGHNMPMATSMALDRIDRTRGYEKDNVRLICNAVNNFRGVMNDAEMATMLKTFHDYYFKPRLVQYGCFLQESEVA